MDTWIDYGNGDNTTFEDRKKLSEETGFIFGEFNTLKFWQNREKPQQNFNHLDKLKSEKK